MLGFLQMLCLHISHVLFSAVNRFEHKNFLGSRLFSSGILYWYFATAMTLFREESLVILFICKLHIVEGDSSYQVTVTLLICLNYPKQILEIKEREIFFAIEVIKTVSRSILCDL